MKSPVPKATSLCPVIFKVLLLPSKLTAPSVILVSLEEPLTPDGVSGRMSGFVDAGINGVSKAYF